MGAPVLRVCSAGDPVLRVSSKSVPKILLSVLNIVASRGGKYVCDSCITC